MEGYENTIFKWPSGTLKTDSYPEASNQQPQGKGTWVQAPSSIASLIWTIFTHIFTQMWVAYKSIRGALDSQVLHKQPHQNTQDILSWRKNTKDYAGVR